MERKPATPKRRRTVQSAGSVDGVTTSPRFFLRRRKRDTVKGIWRPGLTIRSLPRQLGQARAVEPHDDGLAGHIEDEHQGASTHQYVSSCELAEPTDAVITSFVVDTVET